MSRLHRHRKHLYQGMFEEENTRTSLFTLGNPLEALCSVVDFEMFRPYLEECLSPKERKSNAGRPPMDPVLMFKVLFLQRYYGLGDHQIQYQITDRTSFRRFLGIESVDAIPDEKTVWKYRESLTRCRVEHVFGFMEQSVHGLFVRTIGLARAKANVALTSLVYNVCRFAQILRYHPQWVRT